MAGYLIRRSGRTVTHNILGDVCIRRFERIFHVFNHHFDFWGNNNSQSVCRNIIGNNLVLGINYTGLLINPAYRYMDDSKLADLEADIASLQRSVSGMAGSIISKIESLKKEKPEK